MYYELYIDVFFLENFAMDFLLLLLAGKITKCGAKRWRICVGAAIGAFLTCVSLFIPLKNPLIRFILFYGLIFMVMVKVGLNMGWNRSLLGSCVLLYAGAFLFGGIMTALRPFVGGRYKFLALAFAGYAGASAIWELLKKRAALHHLYCDVFIYKGKWSTKSKAMIDSGNCLRDPASGKPVSVIDKKLVEKAKVWPEVLRYIPYHSIGKPDGVMPLICFDRMCVRQNPEVWIESPLFAISPEELSASDYEMLIHPELLS